MITVYSRIKQLCARSNITTHELEKAVGLGYNTINLWETRSPSVKNLLKIAKYFNVSLDYLSGRSNLVETAEDFLNDKDLIFFKKATKDLPPAEKDKLIKIIEINSDTRFDD